MDTTANTRNPRREMPASTASCVFGTGFGRPKSFLGSFFLPFIAISFSAFRQLRDRKQFPAILQQPRKRATTSPLPRELVLLVLGRIVWRYSRMRLPSQASVLPQLPQGRKYST